MHWDSPVLYHFRLTFPAKTDSQPGSVGHFIDVAAGPGLQQTILLIESLTLVELFSDGSANFSVKNA